MGQCGGERPSDAAGRPAASLIATGLLLLMIVCFVGLLAFGRPFLARQIVSNVSVYLVVLVGVTVAVWVLSWAYVLRIGAVDRRQSGRAT